MTEIRLKPDILLTTGSVQTGATICKLLGSSFSVSSVNDAESAWNEIVENQAISVLICELSLATDQFGLLERLRNANEKRVTAMPVLLLIGETDNDESCETAFRAGATDFINMPFVSSELITRVRLHAQLFLKHRNGQSVDVRSTTATNVLQQLAQENVFNSRLQQEISFSQRHKTYFSACKLKLDNLKAIVAGFDRNAAVAVVQAVAGILQQAVRCEDTLCSMGKAEFCILYPATSGIGAAVAINRILQKVSACEIKIAGKQVPVSISAAIYTDIANQDSNAAVILNVLQSRLDEAHAKGGNCVISAGKTDEKNQPSVDRALALIAEQRTEVIASQAGALMKSILPLLEYADGILKLDLNSVNQNLRERLK